MVHFIWRHSHENPQTKEEEKGIFSHEKELIPGRENRAKINLEGKKACPKAMHHMKGCMKYTSQVLYLKLADWSKIEDGESLGVLLMILRTLYL